MLYELLRPVYEIAKPDRFEITELDYWDAQVNWLATGSSPPHGWADYSRFTPEAIPAAGWEEIVAGILQAPFGDAMNNADVVLHGWVGGPVLRGIAPEATAFVHRGAAGLVRASAWWLRGSPSADQERALAWLSAMDGTLQTVASGASYVNFPNGNLSDWANAYYGANLPRLVDVKRQYDPDNVFRFGQSIPLAI